jgi:hypothetical protein
MDIGKNESDRHVDCWFNTIVICDRISANCVSLPLSCESSKATGAILPDRKASPSLPALEVDSGFSYEALRKGCAVAHASRRDA